MEKETCFFIFERENADGKKKTIKLNMEEQRDRANSSLDNSVLSSDEMSKINFFK
jgi:hypothetical protein